MKVRALLVSVGLAAAVVVALATNAVASSSRKEAHKTQILIGASTLGSQFPAVVALNKGLEAEAKKLGVKLVLLDAQGNGTKQNSDVQDLLAQHVQGLIINAFNNETILPVVKAAESQGVPTVAAYTSFGTAKCTYPGTLGYVGFNDLDLGNIAGKEAVKLLPHGGNVAAIVGTSGLASTNNRMAGFRAALKGHSNIKIVSVQPGDFALATARTATANVLSAQPSLQLVFAEDDNMADGAIQALQAANRLKGTKVIGLGGFKLGLKNVKNGSETATVFSSFKNGGALAVQMVVNKILHDKKPANGGCVAVPNYLVTKANVAKYIPLGEV